MTYLASASRKDNVNIHSALAKIFFKLRNQRCSSSMAGPTNAPLWHAVRNKSLSNGPRALPVKKNSGYLVRLCVSQPNFCFCSGWLQLESGPPQSAWRSVVRHSECHCSWKTDKCFCSCRSPLKIPAASMTAARISQALPFTC